MNGPTHDADRRGSSRLSESHRSEATTRHLYKSHTSHSSRNAPGGTMSHQQNPQQQPGWGGPQQPYGQQQYGQPPYGQPPYGQPPFPPQQPPKKSKGKIVGFGCLGIVALFILIGIIAAVAGGGSDDASDNSSKDKAVTATDKATTDGKATTGDKPKEKPAAEKPAEKKTQAEEFQACVAKSGTATEKAAVKHVTKVTGTDKRNDILDNGEVFTDFTGGFMSSNAGDAKLIASAFTSCYESDNGLVSVYGKDGDLIANANY